MRQEPVWAQSLHKREQGGLHVLRPWGTHVHGAVSKTPICPVLASRLLARGSLCRLPASPRPPKKLFLRSPSFSQLPPFLGPQAFPLGCPLCPLPKLPPPRPQQLKTKPHFRLFPVLVVESPEFVSPSWALQPPSQPRGWGMGTPRLPGARRSCILALLLTRHLSPTRPLRPQGTRRVGVKGGGGYEGTPDREGESEAGFQ